MKYRIEFAIYGDNDCIRFDNYIECLERLLDKLNDQIAKYQIPVFEVDRGRETRRAPVATLVAVAQGKSLDGMRTPATKL